MYRYLLLYCLLLNGVPGWAQDRLAERVTAFVSWPELRGAQIGVHVVDVATGRQLAAHQPYTNFIPASTLKLLTTAVAADVLGPDYRFRTELYYRGEIRDGVLHGDIYIKGGGDPTLGSPYMDGALRLPAVLERWRAAIAGAGIRQVRGHVVGLDDHFGTDGVGAGWPWADLGNYYGVGAYGLNLHENSYSLDLLQRSREGERPILQGTRPEQRDLQIVNELVSGPRGSGDQAYIFAAPYATQAYVRGSIPVGSGRFTIRGAIPDPALFAARALRDALEASGVPVSLPAQSLRSIGGRVTDTGILLDTYSSPPLAEIIDRTNLRSSNLYAEALLRAINRERGAARHELAGTGAVADWLDERGFADGGWHIADGSGLGPRNFISPSLLTALLRSQAGNTRWRESLPVAGRTGSMRGYLRGRAAEGRLAAKSGSLEAVRCYAGYATTKSGRELAFAIMVNNHTVEGRVLRDRMLELMNALCEE